jgi:ATP-dependent RNA helicase DOB1
MRKVLRALGHVTREGVIALKGRAACELNTADELVVSELLMEGVFQDLDAAVAVALLSCLCHTEKAKEGALPPPLRGALQGAYEQLRSAATTVARACVAAGLPVDEVEYVDRFNPNLMEVLFQWANGAKFVDLTKLTDAFEGTIIRVIRRLDELLRQLASAAFAVGNFELKAKFDDASAKIKRDIVFAASLYL